MNYNWQEFEFFSKEIIKHRNARKCPVSEETLARNAISRLFYHAFHCIQNWLVDVYRYSKPSDKTTHKGIVDFLTSNGKSCSKILSQYERLKKLRVMADYYHQLSKLNELLREAQHIHKKITQTYGQFSKKI